MDNDKSIFRAERQRRRDAEARRQVNPFAPLVRTGTCAHCGKPMFDRRADARFCSTKCRTAACRKALPPPATRKVQKLQAEVQRLVAENARLQALVQRLQAGQSRPEPLVQRLPSTEKERDLAAEARRAKLLRAEERAKRVLRRRKV